MLTNRDIIIIAGPSGCGKSYTAKVLRDMMDFYGIHYEQEAITDAQSLLKRVQIDDILKGLNHYHQWYTNKLGGHTHTKKKPKVPFTTIGNILIDGKYVDFFQKLEQLPKTGKFWFVEWMGGINTNVSNKSPFHYTYSFEKVDQLLRFGNLPSSWLQRVYIVIHPVTARAVRRKLNKKRSLPTKEEIKLGTASWPMSEEAMNFSGKDDFSKIKKLFNESQAIGPFEVKNNGDEKYKDNITGITKDIFLTKFYISPRKKEQKDIILVAGRICSGKKTILDTLYKTAKKWNIGYNYHYLSDTEAILAKIREDDRNGGFRHYHPWSKSLNGHTHAHGEPIAPFVITSNELIYEMWRNYFTKLNTLPKTKKLWFVELTGGVNIATDETISHIDRSFKKIGDLMVKNILPTDWLERVYGVLHPMADDIIVKHFDEGEHIHMLEGIKKDIVSPQKNETIYKVFGKDDFFEIGKILHKKSIPYIYHFQNEGKESFEVVTEKITNVILSQQNNLL